MNIKELIQRAHGNAKDKGFWDMELRTLRSMQENELDEEEIKTFVNAMKSQKLALIHSEVSEALEAARLGDQENHEEEMADILIRVLDYCGGYHIDLEKAVLKKMERNESRPRLHGKKF